MNPFFAVSCGPKTGQRGAVLIMALMFLTLLTLLGVTAMTSSTSEEKMARATRDYNTAFQAAEAAMRDAESDINGNGSRNPVFLGAAYWFDVPLRIAALGGCANGACIPPAPLGIPVWEVAANWNNAATYAQFTFAQALPASGPGAVGQAPQYLIEFIGTVGSQSAYRITARGWGPNSVQTVTLQEEVLK